MKYPIVLEMILNSTSEPGASMKSLRTPHTFKGVVWAQTIYHITVMMQCDIDHTLKRTRLLPLFFLLGGQRS